MADRESWDVGSGFEEENSEEEEDSEEEDSEDSEEQYEVEKILAARGGEYHVKWKGYPRVALRVCTKIHRLKSPCNCCWSGVSGRGSSCATTTLACPARRWARGRAVESAAGFNGKHGG
jgi:hypothetical protein